MNKICYVTSFLYMDRDTWSVYPRNFDQYLQTFTPYINLFKNDDTKSEMFVYIDERLYTQVRDIIPESLPITLIKINEDFLRLNIPMWNRLKREDEIMKSEKYKVMFAHRIHFPESCHPKYTLINHCKIDFIAHTTHLSDSDYFCWCDFGYFKIPENIPKKLIDINKNLNKNKINYTLINPLDDRDNDIMYTMNYYPERIGGFFFLGNRENMLKYQQLFHQVHQWFQDNNLADDDQTLAMACYYQNQELFSLHLAGGWHKAFVYFQKS
jgi:hypothetical protein